MMKKILRMYFDIMCIIYILLMHLWLMELLDIDLIKIHESIFE